jgi:hypothetical protein
VPNSLIRDYTQLRTDVVGPVFTKIWDTPGSGYAERMKHVIEPAFTVDYTTPINNYKRTPILTDSSDFVVGGTSRVTYGLTNRMMYRGKTVDGVRGQTREFVTVGIQQTYYSNSESSKFDTSYSSSNTGRKPVQLSPISLNARVSPSSNVDANTRLEYDVNGACGPEFRHSAVQPPALLGHLETEQLFLRIDVASITERPLHRHVCTQLGSVALDDRHAERARHVHGAVLRDADRISEIPPRVLGADSVGSAYQLLIRACGPRELLEFLRGIR